MTDVSEVLDDKDYEFGFHDNVKPVYSTGLGLTEDTVREISKAKDEPKWMLDYRLKAYHAYLKMSEPGFGPDLTGLDLEHMKFFQRATDKQYRDWDDVPQDIKTTFDRLGVPQAERKYLAGSSAQYESEVVYHKMEEQFDKLGIIFTDTDTALKKVPGSF